MNNKTEIKIPCECGAQSVVVQSRSGWYSHCLNCGTMRFWKNPVLTERVKVGAPLCSHHPEWKVCQNGTSKTSWCSLCRVRSFVPVVPDK